jgi:transposase
VPAIDRSGERDPQKRISKEGDEMLRKLFVGSAHYVLGPFGSDSDLRRHGQKIAARGGKNSKKRAAVVVARKLSVLLHRLWVSGEVYDPLHNAHRRQGQEEQLSYRGDGADERKVGEDHRQSGEEPKERRMATALTRDSASDLM